MGVWIQQIVNITTNSICKWTFYRERFRSSLPLNKWDTPENEVGLHEQRAEYLKIGNQ